MKTIIGKLEEKLVLRTENELIVIPAGTIIEVKSHDNWAHQTDINSIEDAARYLEEND